VGNPTYSYLLHLRQQGTFETDDPAVGHAPAVRGGMRAMSRAEEFRKNAAQCSDLASASRLESDREQWLSLHRFWLDRAEEENRRERPDAQTSVE
jgi:hypothetical protein